MFDYESVAKPIGLFGHGLTYARNTNTTVTTEITMDRRRTDRRSCSTRVVRYTKDDRLRVKNEAGISQAC